MGIPCSTHNLQHRDRQRIAADQVDAPSVTESAGLHPLPNAFALFLPKRLIAAQSEVLARYKVTSFTQPGSVPSMLPDAA
jgi:hypothetical protein